MTDRLAIYNGALLICGERSLASLTENREPRRLLDQVWNDNGVQHCLEAGQWNFAMRAAKMDADPSIVPSFGYPMGFTKPDDWVNTSAVCSDEYFRVPLMQYADEIDVWFAAITPIYVKFVSNDPNFGLNFAAWPDSFTEYVKHYFAGKIIMKLANSEARQKTLLGRPGTADKGLIHDTLISAKNRDAMAKPPTRPAQGMWSRSRQGGWGNRGPFGDGGTNNSLIG